MMNDDLITVPAHIKGQKCKYCPATIYMVRIEHRWTPVHCDVPNGQRPNNDSAAVCQPGKGINHFIDCDKAEEARAKVKAEKAARQLRQRMGQGELL